LSETPPDPAVYPFCGEWPVRIKFLTVVNAGPPCCQRRCRQTAPGLALTRRISTAVVTSRLQVPASTRLQGISCEFTAVHCQHRPGGRRRVSNVAYFSEFLWNAAYTSSTAISRLPKLGSRVRIPSPAPNLTGHTNEISVHLPRLANTGRDPKGLASKPTADVQHARAVGDPDDTLAYG
jgi:hypothetical protein